jgi:hypothetical protein
MNERDEIVIFIDEQTLLRAQCGDFLPLPSLFIVNTRSGRISINVSAVELG